MLRAIARPRSLRALPLAALLAALLVTGSATAQVAPTLAKLSEQTGIAEDTLEKAGCAALLESDVYARRNHFQALCKEPRGDLLPLVAYLAEKEPDWPLRLTAVKTISCFALRADRSVVLARVVPALEANIRGSEPQLQRWSLEELNGLNRWFRMDEVVAPILEVPFRGADFNLRSLAFRGIQYLKHPRLVKELVIPAAWEVYGSKKSGLFDRRSAVRTFVYHEQRDAIPKLQWNLRKDGRVAIVSAWGLTRMLDPTSLKELRKINHTAVHSLRMLCWRARTLLNDERCLKDVQKVVNNKNEHDEIKRAFVADLGNFTDHTDKVAKLLAAYAKHKSKAVRTGAAIAKLRQDDASGADLVTETLLGAWPDDQKLGRKGNGWMRQLRLMDTMLRIETDAVGPVLVAMLDVTPEEAWLYDKDGKAIYERWFRFGGRRDEKLRDWYDEYLADAISACGERRIEASMDRLQEICKSDWGHPKLHALVSRIELGDEKALWSLKYFLPKYDDRLYRSVKAIMGKTTLYTERMKWSTVFSLCDKFERRGPQDKDVYLPIIREMLMPEAKGYDPMGKGWATKVRGGAAAGARGAGGGSTKGRGDAGRGGAATGGGASGPASPLMAPPEVPYRMRNQFARRRLVQSAARLGGTDAAPLLALALRDCRATVRSAALTEIGSLTGLYELPEGSHPDQEPEAWEKAVAWLTKQGAWPD